MLLYLDVQLYAMNQGHRDLQRKLLRYRILEVCNETSYMFHHTNLDLKQCGRPLLQRLELNMLLQQIQMRQEALQLHLQVRPNVVQLHPELDS